MFPCEQEKGNARFDRGEGRGGVTIRVTLPCRVAHAARRQALDQRDTPSNAVNPMLPENPGSRLWYGRKPVDLDHVWLIRAPATGNGPFHWPPDMLAKWGRSPGP